jgi:hypothetical protein
MEHREEGRWKREEGRGKKKKDKGAKGGALPFNARR